MQTVLFMWVILPNNARWDCFKTPILQEILRTQNPFLEEHYVCVSGMSAIPPTISVFSTCLILPVVTHLSHSLQHLSHSCCVHLTIHPNARLWLKSLSSTKTAHTHLNITYISHMVAERGETPLQERILKGSANRSWTPTVSQVLEQVTTLPKTSSRDRPCSVQWKRFLMFPCRRW